MATINDKQKKSQPFSIKTPFPKSIQQHTCCFCT